MGNRKELLEAAAERQQNYRANRQQRGEVRISTWVPKEHAQELHDLAAKYRREAEIRDGVTKRPPIQIPKAEIPQYPPRRLVLVRIERDEIGLQKLAKANGGTWVSSKQAWEMRDDVIGPLGLTNRVVSGGETAGSRPGKHDESPLPLTQLPGKLPGLP